MTPTLPIGISRSPAASLSTLSDVVSSYRRAQTFLSSSNITTADAFPDYLRQQEEQRDIHDYDDLDEIEEISDEARTPRALEMPEPAWDEVVYPSRESQPRTETHERTPLLKKVSWHHDLQTATPEQRRPSIRRHSSRSSVSSKLSEYYYEGGKSTYKQTLFNAIAILLGIGMLSEPLAFAYAGWIPGTILIIFYGYITCYTAKILARIITEDPSLRTFADIGYKAFGPRSTVLTGILFCLELFAVGVVLVTLYGDSLHLVIPSFTSNQYKIMGLVVIIPTIFLPLYILSYASVLGIISTILIIVCIAFDGLIKTEAPGSLWDPAPTQWFVKDARTVGVSFGLFMAGFGGHAVMPSLAKDMQNPQEFDEMINWAFAIATGIYGIIGAAGYLMFGTDVHEEVSKNILGTPGYPTFINKLTVWMLVIAPLSKFALNTRPLNLTMEIWLGIDNAHSQPQQQSRPPSPTSKSAAALSTSVRNTSRPILMVFERIVLTLLAVTVSILVPEFSTLMAFLGSFSAFMLCVIGPVCAKICIERQCSYFDGVLLASSIVFMIWGTVAAFSESV